MKYLLAIVVMLVVSIPVAAQEFQSVRPTLVVPSAGALRDPVTGWTFTQVRPHPPWVFVRPTVPLRLVPPPVRWPPLLLFQTKRGLQGWVIEGSVALPIGPSGTGLFDGPGHGLWDDR